VTERGRPQGRPLSTDGLAERLRDSAIGMLDLFAVYAGDRLGWYAALQAGGPSTADELAAATGTHERYVREWLEHQAAGGLLDVDDVAAAPAARRYSLPVAHAEVLLDRSSLDYSAPMSRFAAALGGLLPQLLGAFRTGSGVPWEAFGADGREAQADINRPLYERLLGQEWLPAVPDVHDRLSRPGAQVADVACGGGWSTIAIARAYPETRVDGYDLDAESIELARANAAEAGVADRVAFHVRDVTAGEPGTYDLVCVFEAIHDMSRPVEVLSALRAMAGEDGAVIVMDERTAERFTAPADRNDRFLYGVSLFCCLPAGMSEQPSAATGTVMRPDTLRRYARAAGFGDVTILPIEHDVFRFYRLA
jgi:2-polyprenyl-3-methyl-5-hydroxy-6-metoxy-1,4-benzoquinol methylase